ncbi:MAG: DNA polymerase I [Limnochordales bacterium]|nr:DNA polymerase I [Limnochordales bacterium]
MSEEKSQVVLVDGHSLLHRAFHALPPLMTSAGEPTQAVLGFTRMLLRLVKEEKPLAVVVAFDRPTPTFRHQQFSEYKATRPPAPEELRVQVRRVHELLEAMGVAIREVDGFEADDILGTLSRKAREAGLRALVVTGDRDCLQLAADIVEVLLTRKGISDLARLDAGGVRELLGIEPSQVPDWKALVGDSSDNLPGVPGIGEKTATQLLNQYRNLEEIFARLDELPARVAKYLRDGAIRERALRVRELATICRDAPVDLDLEAARFGPPDWPRLDALLTELEFRQLRKDLEELFGPDRDGAESSGVAPAVSPPPGRGDLAGKASGGQVVTASSVTAVWVDDPEEARKRILALRRLGETGYAPAELPAVAVEVVDLLARDGDGRGPGSGSRPGSSPDQGLLLGLESGPGPELVLGLATRDGAVLLPAAVVRALRAEIADWLGSRDWLKVGFDIKEAMHRLKHLDLTLDGPAFDTLIASYLLNPNATPLDPLELAATFNLHPAGVTVTGVSSAAANQGAPQMKHLVANLQVQPLLARRLEEDKLAELFWEVEMPLVHVLAAMEEAGVAIDVELLRRMSQEMGREIDRLTEQIYQKAGTRFNLNSPKQLAEILFERLGLPVIRKTKTGPSTGADVLEELADKHEIVALILDYRQLVKLKSTYVDALPGLVNPATGRVHTTFHQTVTATGRLSSSDPNLQNIPVRSEEGKRIRQAFVAPPGHVLLTADYSQIELRVLAHMSDDRALQEAFFAETDIHTRTAAEVFGVPVAEVTPAQRNAAKAINFGIIYGISGYGLARGTGLTREAAQAYIDAYFARYPGVKRYMDETVERAKRDGYVTTLLGRRRFIPELRAANYAQRSFGQRMAMNTPIQGSAADIMKVAMVEVYRRLQDRGLGSRMVLQVHDELVLEVPEAEVDEVAALVKDAMEHCVELKVPLRVDVEVGKNWADTQPWQPACGR